LVAESPEQRADRLRGEGMNRLSRLGVFSNDNVASRSPEQRAERLRSEGLNKMYGLGDFASTSTGNDIEWQQIGIGLGIGIALMLGLLVAFRSTRQRPLAH